LVTSRVNLYKDLKIFIKISSKGAFSVLALMIFIFIICFITLGNTSFKFTLLPEPFKPEMENLIQDSRTIALINFNPVPIAGVLAVGYFIHPCVIPVIRKSSIQKNQERDIIYGYCLVFLSYFSVGIAGYIGFMGIEFAEYAKYADKNNWPIAQNCITMFDSKDIAAFIIQLFLLVLCCSTYPIVSFFFISGSIKMYKAYRGVKISEEHDEEYLGRCQYNTFIILSNCIPFVITIFFPQVAVVLGFIGSIVGLFVIYLMPVLTYLKKLKGECENLQVSEANQIYLDSLNKRLYGHD